MKILRFGLLLFVVCACNVASAQKCGELIESAQRMGIYLDARGLMSELKKREVKDSGYYNLRGLAESINDMLVDGNKKLHDIANNVTEKDTAMICTFFNEFINYKKVIDSIPFMKDKDSINFLLQVIQEDLLCKYWSSGRGGPSSPPTYEPTLKAIKVRVLNKNGNELPGYSVYVKPELSINPFLTERFNPTNNALKSISPGRKFVWIEKGGKRIQSATVGVRITDEENRTIDFVID